MVTQNYPEVSTSTSHEDKVKNHDTSLPSTKPNLESNSKVKWNSLLKPKVDSMEDTPPPPEVQANRPVRVFRSS